MTKNAQRLSQVVSTFGPGSMVDLPTRSIVVGGLEEWEMPPDSFTLIPEQRLITRLEQILKQRGRLDSEKNLSLRTPPLAVDRLNAIPRGIGAFIFPKWFVCEQSDGIISSGKMTRRRRLVPWQALDTNGRRKFAFDDGKKSDVTPIRFVCACEKGHMQDIEWRWVVHGPVKCQEPMWVEEKGISADPADTSVVCGCGRQLSLREAFQPGRLGKCRGERPWLLDVDPEGCGERLKLLTRTATNTYFPQVYTVISLPTEEDELTRLVDALVGELAGVQNVADIAQAKKFNPKISTSFGKYADAEIFDRLKRIRDNAKADATRSPKLSEFDIFASGHAEIGYNHPSAKLYAQTLPRHAWTDALADIDLASVKNLVAVHRLREVSCLYGFTRFEAAPTSADGDIEDVQLAVRGAPISRDSDWLPAIEQFGEGIFIHFDEVKIRQWLENDAVIKRHGKLVNGYAHWARRFPANPPKYPSTPYIFLHSLSHALMSEIALDCGYPASSLKERVYALQDTKDGKNNGINRCGILIYTASAGAQGTLGGLVGIAPRFATILRSALERAAICSNDPICADHEPDDRSGDRATHGAACHGCLLIAETSCEIRNLFLDRNLLMPTMANDGSAFFSLKSS